ncbi:MAG: hypothetical protein JWQ09_5782, partial [Segetibacter sp.]|nr:hypothetical protein [Segetibacter sp.]
PRGSNGCRYFPSFGEYGIDLYKTFIRNNQSITHEISCHASIHKTELDSVTVHLRVKYS